jgi:co-chaperonin GroES (HSP10)
MPHYNANSFKPHADKVFVAELERGDRKTSGGIILADDDMKNHGIRPRWGQVWKVGSNVIDVKPGDWLFIEHGRWTYGMDFETDDGRIVRVWHIDFPDAALLQSDEDPRLESFKDSFHIRSLAG